jgi:hypothetical protein
MCILDKMYLSIIKPFFEQFPLLLHKNDLFRMALERVFHLISARSRNIQSSSYGVLLIAESVSIVLYEHIVHLCLLLLNLFLYLSYLIARYNICYNLLQIIVVEFALLLFSFWLCLFFNLEWLYLIGARTWNWVNWLFQLAVNSLSGLIFKDARGLGIFFNWNYCLSVFVSSVGEVEIISEVIIFNGDI